MKIKFYKYQGTGNDFIMIDNRDGAFPKEVRLIEALCHRNFGIGSDGLILIENSKKADFIMDFYNPDGSQSFCGNGSRCAVSFARFLDMVGKDLTFEAIDGVHEAKIADTRIHIKMGDVNKIELGDDHYFIDTGSPHYIFESDNVPELDMVSEGRAIRYNKRFAKEGTNVNVVQKLEDRILIRTYERGVENETLSCGTGVTAAALSCLHKQWFKDEVIVETAGGQLRVKAEREGNEFKNIWLIGPAKQVFKGEINV